MLGVSALLLSGCGAAPEENAASESGSPAASTDFLACMVSDSGGFDDQSFNQSSYEGLKAAEADLGIKIKTIESQSETDFIPNLDAMAAAGCNLTFTAGFLLADATQEAAIANPDKNFAFVDGATEETLPNVKPILFDTAQAAFLAGYVAAGTTDTGKVATYGGIQLPTVTIFMDGFADGVDYYNEEQGAQIELLGWDKETQTGSFTGNFTDAVAGKTTTQNFINEGVDIIMPVAGPVGAGTLEAIAEANGKGGRTNLAIWVDSDGFETTSTGREFILTSVMKRMGVSVEDVIQSDVDGSYDSAPYVGTLANGGVALAPYHDQEAIVPDEVKTSVEEIKAKIISGEITVDSQSTPQ